MTYKFGFISDIHISDVAPLGRQPGYKQQILDKLHGIAELSHSRKWDSLVIGGDVFHQKRPDRVSHMMVQEIIDILRHEIKGDVYIVPGNHDLTEEGLASLSRQPLGVIFKAGAAAMLGSYEQYDQKNVHLIGRAYETNTDCDPFAYPMTEMEAKHSGVHIMVAHGSIVPPGSNPIYPHVNLDSIPWDENDMPIPDLLLAGHLHECYGMWDDKLVPQDCPPYVNLGSFGRPSRNAWVDARDFLEVAVSTDGTLRLEKLPIPHMLPAEEVFLEKVEQADDEAMAEFAEQLASGILLEEQSLDDILDNLRADIPKKVRKEVRRYLEEAGL